MLKKLIWLAVFALIVFGVYSIGPYVAKRYRAHLAEKTAKMARQVNDSSQQIADPAAAGAVRKTRELEQRTNEMEKEPE